MARKSAGLYKRGNVYHIDKVICGDRVCRSTGEKTLKGAESFLAQIIKEKKDAKIYGIRPDRTFKEASEKYLAEKDKSSLKNDAIQITMLLPFIGKENIKNIHMGTLQKFIKHRQKEAKNVTINHALQVVRHMLNTAATDWIDEHGLTWLEHPPRIKPLTPDKNRRKPMPLSWEEQRTLFAKLPSHLYDMALFKVNTGTREQEVCNLKWEWEVNVPELPDTTIFVIPSEFVKNRQDRIVVLNDVAKKVVNSRRGKNKKYVFSYRGKKLSKMNNTAWRKGREEAKLATVRVHDLKHTYGSRLRAVGVQLEDRQDLLGHKSSKITSHYSKYQIEDLIKASNKIVNTEVKKPQELFMIR